MGTTRWVKRRHELGRAGMGITEMRAAMADSGVPDEMLRLIDTAASPEEAMARLIEAGVVPSEEESLDALLSGWSDLLEPGCDQLMAELYGVEFLAILSDMQPDAEAAADLLATLIAQAEESGTPEGLAMLRVLEVLAPEHSRPAAAKGAARLVDAGLRDRPWVRGLGQPEAGRCFGYVDPVGQQEAMAITFRYGRRRHGLAVLIDHGLGGGIRDCWLTDRPAEVRAQYQQVAQANPGIEFLEYTPARARRKLERALERQPCPADAEQAQDVDDFLDLLRRRVVLLLD